MLTKIFLQICFRELCILLYFQNPYTISFLKMYNTCGLSWTIFVLEHKLSQKTGKMRKTDIKKFRKAVIQSALQSNFGSSSPILFHLLFFFIILPDGDHDGWGLLHWTDYCLRFPKIYDTWGIWGEIVIKNLPVLGGCSWSSWPSWWLSWLLGSSPLNCILPKVSKNIGYMGYLRINSCHLLGVISD